MCGFIPLTNPDGERRHILDLDHQITLHHDADQPIDPRGLKGILDASATPTWSGVVVGDHEPFNGIWLRLTAAEPGACWLSTRFNTATPAPRPKLVPPRTCAVVEDTSLAHLTFRRLADLTPGDADLDLVGQPSGTRSELGALGFGPHGPQLAKRINQQIRTWARDRTLPLLTAHPATTTADQLPEGTVLDKHHVRLVLTYPHPRP